MPYIGFPCWRFMFLYTEGYGDGYLARKAMEAR